LHPADITFMTFHPLGSFFFLSQICAILKNVLLKIDILAVLLILFD